MKKIALVGTFDTKAKEFLYVKDVLEELGNEVVTIDVGVFEPSFKPDISSNEVTQAVGVDIADIREKEDRSYGTDTLARGAAKKLPELYEEGAFDGVLSMGGSGGTSIATAGMRELPIGVPKVMVSTMASGNVEPYVGTTDIVMLPSVVDVSGLNEISKVIYHNGAAAISGMVNHDFEEKGDTPLIAASMFGLTTPAVNYAREYLEERGYEVLVFHATGTGGKTLENLTGEGYFTGVLDLTITELVDELIGGNLTAGPDRLEAASRHKIPQVISLGAMDMGNFGPYDLVPQEYQDRTLYKHNPSVTLMRMSKEDNEQLGKIIADKLNLAVEKTTLIIPLQGFSGIDKEGEAFAGKEEDQVLIDTILENLDNSNVEIIKRDEHINDQSFGEFAAKKLLESIEGGQ
jgi:uncharacterized protein (UPF0261 family)